MDFLNSFIKGLKDQWTNKFTLTHKSIIISLLLMLITATIFMFLKTEAIGWLLMIVVFLFCIYLQIKFVGNDLFKAIILIVLPVVATLSIFSFTTNPKDNKETDNKETKSSVVSKGVNLDDLGNILNGQYYFDDGVDQVYSTFDYTGSSHIYITNKKNNTTKSIFDGFGWSFVINDSWIYFSGNEGKVIDATYNLFRIKKDGSDLERLNSNYCYNMFFYKEWLYYQRQSDKDAEFASLYRSNIDGTNETEVVANTGGLGIVYENKLYYLGSDNYIYISEPNGLNPTKLINEKIYSFIIGQGKLIYVDDYSNIKTAKIDGTDIKITRPTDGDYVVRINSYKNTIFYVKYDDNYLDERRAYPYHVHSIGVDGTNDIKIYDGISWGYYVNILNDKVYVLDYAEDLLLDKFIAVTRHMELNGSNIVDLYRN